MLLLVSWDWLIGGGGPDGLDSFEDHLLLGGIVMEESVTFRLLAMYERSVDGDLEIPRHTGVFLVRPLWTRRTSGP